MRKENVSVKNVKTTNIRTGEVKQSKVETTTLDERPSIWNLQAFAIVFLFIMLATTINVYSVNNDNLTWVDSNGDFKLDSYNHSMINLDTDLEELNGNSLNDVFREGNLQVNYDFSDGTNGYTSNGVGFQVVNGIAEFTANSTFDSITSSNALVADLYDYIFLLGYVKTLNTNVFIDSLWANPQQDDFQKHSGSGNFEILYGKVQKTNTNASKIRVIDRNTSSWSLIQVDFLYGVNMTDLGIESLSESDMLYWYSEYQILQENRIEAYKELGNEPISQWQNLTQHLQLVIDAIMGPIDNISDWINKFMNGLFS